MALKAIRTLDAKARQLCFKKIRSWHIHRTWLKTNKRNQNTRITSRFTKNRKKRRNWYCSPRLTNLRSNIQIRHCHRQSNPWSIYRFKRRPHLKKENQLFKIRRKRTTRIFSKVRKLWWWTSNKISPKILNPNLCKNKRIKRCQMGWD